MKHPYRSPVELRLARAASAPLLSLEEDLDAIASDLRRLLASGELEDWTRGELAELAERVAVAHARIVRAAARAKARFTAMGAVLTVLAGLAARGEVGPSTIVTTALAVGMASVLLLLSGRMERLVTSAGALQWCYQEIFKMVIARAQVRVAGAGDEDVGDFATLSSGRKERER